jgi:hypothetical protein
MTTGPRSADVRSGFAGCRPHCVRLPPILTARFSTHTDHHVSSNRHRNQSPGTRPGTRNVSRMMSLIVSRINRFGRSAVTSPLTSPVTSSGRHRPHGYGRRGQEMFTGDKVGDEFGEHLGDVDVASLAGLAVVPEDVGNEPGTGGHREVHIVWSIQGQASAKDWGDGDGRGVYAGRHVDGDHTSGCGC